MVPHWLKIRHKPKARTTGDPVPIAMLRETARRAAERNGRRIVTTTDVAIVLRAYARTWAIVNNGCELVSASALAQALSDYQERASKVGGRVEDAPGEALPLL